MPGFQTFYGEQVRAGRALARIDQIDLAKSSGVSLETVKRIESIRGPAAVNSRTRAAIVRAFAERGIAFDFYGSGGAGVRLGGDGVVQDRGVAVPPPWSSPYNASAASATPIGVAMIAYWDRNLQCRFANEGYLEWFGRPREEMIGLSMPELMGPTLFSNNEGFIRAALTGEPQTFERTIRKPSGSVGHTLAHYIPDADPAGVVQGVRALVLDATALKQAELTLASVGAFIAETRRKIEATVDQSMTALDTLTLDRVGRAMTLPAR